MGRRGSQAQRTPRARAQGQPLRAVARRRLSLNHPPSTPGYYKCDPAVKVGRPTTFQELISLVTTFSRVKAVGVGHSWWQQQFCAGTEPTALGLVLTEFPSVLKSYVLTPDAYPLALSPRGFGYGVGDVPWKLDDVLAPTTVTALAGVGTRALLDWLAQQKPTPLTLPAFPWYIDQTIGGAVATATHGSSLQYGSLSQQVTAIELVIADGSVREFTPADGYLFQAVVAHVGRLGVTTRVTLRVVPAVPVRRSVVKESWDAMVAEISTAAAAYTAAIAANNPTAATAALAPLTEVDYFPYVPLRKAWKVNYTRLDPASTDGEAATIVDAAAEAKLSAADAARQVRDYVTKTKGSAAAAALDGWIADRDAAADGLLSKLNTTGLFKGAPTLDTVAVAALPGHHLGKGYVGREAQIYGVAAALDAATASNNAPGAYNQWPKSVAVPPAPLYKYDWCDHSTWSSIFSIAMGVNLRPGVYSARAAYASQSALPSVLLSDINPYDQYEANIPMSRVPACLAAVTEVLYGPSNAAAGFRTTPLIRFSSPDDALISPANRGEPSMVSVGVCVVCAGGRGERVWVDVFSSSLTPPTTSPSTVLQPRGPRLL